MALFGHARDISLFRNVSRELISRIVEQKVGYYKFVLDKTNSNIYGEATEKFFNDPVLINCRITRGDQEFSADDMGPDVKRTVTCAFLRDDLVESYKIVPEVGDIILWNEDYYEVDSLLENQYVVGKYPEYTYDDTVEDFGSSISIIVTAQYVRPDKLNLRRNRL